MSFLGHTTRYTVQPTAIQTEDIHFSVTQTNCHLEKSRERMIACMSEKSTLKINSEEEYIKTSMNELK